MNYESTVRGGRGTWDTASWPSQAPTTYCWAALLMLILMTGTTLASDRSPKTEAEIAFLLDHVRNANMSFIRNEQQHTPEEAYDHMQAKLRHFDRRIDTTEAFIDYAASRSTLSGRDYRVRLPDGLEVTSRDYLLTLLAEFRAKHEATK